MRSVVALLGVLLVLLLGVRPLIKALRPKPAALTADGAADGIAGLPPLLPAGDETDGETGDGKPRPVDHALLAQHVGLAQRLVAERPDNAVVALRQMLNAEPQSLKPEPAQ